MWNGWKQRRARDRRAYNLEDAGDNFISEKKPAEALQAYEAAMKLAPDIVELQFWAAVSMYTNDRKPEALKICMPSDSFSMKEQNRTRASATKEKQQTIISLWAFSFPTGASFSIMRNTAAIRKAKKTPPKPAKKELRALRISNWAMAEMKPSGLFCALR